MKKVLYLLLACVLFSSCSSGKRLTRSEQYAKMYEETPVTLLIMPPINNTANVEAKDLLFTSINAPLAEAGYYVISPIMSMELMRQESAYDAELFYDNDVSIFKKVFGADAVVFSQIDTWRKVGIGIQTKVRYVIKSTQSNEVLFDRSCDLFLDLTPDKSSSKKSEQTIVDLLFDIAEAAINTATTESIVAARKCNYYILSDLPRGKYSPDYLKDKDVEAAPKDVQTTVR